MVRQKNPIHLLILFSLTSMSINAGNGQTAYFRGRKLRGRRVELPEGYEGG